MGEQQIFNQIIEFFEEDEWDFQWMEGMSVLQLGFNGKNGKWTCYAQARESQQQFVFYSVLSINVPEDKRPAIAEFITRANYGMVIGNFEMDFNDGEVRYKTSVDVEGTELSPPMIRQLVYANIVITDRYLPGIMRVVYSDTSPADIIESIEKSATTSPASNPDKVNGPVDEQSVLNELRNDDSSPDDDDDFDDDADDDDFDDDADDDDADDDDDFDDDDDADDDDDEPERYSGNGHV